MQDDHQKTLFHPFDAGPLDPPSSGERLLVLNAPAGFRTPIDWDVRPTLVQDFRATFLALERSGYRVVPQPEGNDYDVALVLAGRHRGQNENWIAEAVERLSDGGLLVVAGGKAEGAASLRKRLGEMVDLDGHASKNHGVVFWLTCTDDAHAASAALKMANPVRSIDGYVTMPGLFSHERIDAGSLLLVQNLPDDLTGRAADFGAGWGYLSVELARRAPGLVSVDLFEASFAACETARRNIATMAPAIPGSVVWLDLLSEPVARGYDLIVMNPPFHQGRAAEPSIGEGVIRAASAALKPGGRLLLVANRELPYEAVLQGTFARHGELCRDGRYKVLWAVR